jgi:hypothetical protein
MIPTQFAALKRIFVAFLKYLPSRMMNTNYSVRLAREQSVAAARHMYYSEATLTAWMPSQIHGCMPQARSRNTYVSQLPHFAPALSAPNNYLTPLNLYETHFMKKILLSLFAAFTLISFTQVAFANSAPTTPYHSKIETIENALQKSTTKGYGPSTNIVVINYTDSVVTVAYPVMYPTPILTPRTATRITNDSWTGYTSVHLADSRTGQIFYINDYVAPQAMLSVYVYNGAYVVNLS